MYLHTVAGKIFFIVAYDGCDAYGIAVVIIDDEVVIVLELPALGLARLVAHEVVVVGLREIAVPHAVLCVLLTFGDALVADIEEDGTGDVLQLMDTVLAPGVADERRY
jgi:hypothetical protein